jgi:predicted  nucleic acid-binding Zn-ribbon protein
MNESSERSYRALMDQKSDYEEKMKELKDKIRSLSVELDMERNQMSAQEEMLHSLVHNISLEFVTQN